ncbi:MAG: hypothetical protein DRP66_12060 [Planctomycetota bacterium]|nr:MAG: hypothetical protein DRP66_12060 [Planctomycetota bacterium]
MPATVGSWSPPGEPLGTATPVMCTGLPTEVKKSRQEDICIRSRTCMPGLSMPNSSFTPNASKLMPLWIIISA